MNIPTLSAEEVATALARMDMLPVAPIEFIGETTFISPDGWRFDVFNTRGSAKYVDSATAPDGRTANTDNWKTEENFNNPLDLALGMLDREGMTRLGTILSENGKCPWVFF